MVRPPSRSGARRASATVELAVLLPLLVFLLVITIDYARIFYFSLTIANCARNGAIYASDPYSADESPYANIQEAALADASNLTSPAPAVSSTTGTDSDGRAYVEVTVTYTFRTVTHFPGVPDVVTLSRTVRMAKAPLNPS